MSPRLGFTVSFRRQRELRHSICPTLPAPLAARYGLSHRQGFATAIPAYPLTAATGCVHKALERWPTFPPPFGIKSIPNLIELQRTILHRVHRPVGQSGGRCLDLALTTALAQVKI